MRKCFADESKICDCQPTAGRICEGVVALRKDAERYRYLRENFASVGMGGVELIWDQPDPCDALDGLVDCEMLRMPAVG